MVSYVIFIRRKGSKNLIRFYIGGAFRSASMLHLRHASCPIRLGFLISSRLRGEFLPFFSPNDLFFLLLARFCPISRRMTAFPRFWRVFGRFLAERPLFFDSGEFLAIFSPNGRYSSILARFCPISRRIDCFIFVCEGLLTALTV